jgi:hypothetical protein
VLRIGWFITTKRCAPADGCADGSADGCADGSAAGFTCPGSKPNVVPLLLLLLGGGRWRPPIIRGFTGGQCAASACSAAGNAVDKHRATSAFALAPTTNKY